MKTNDVQTCRFITGIKQFLSAASVVLLLSNNISAQDLPSPAANLQTLPNGSYVIAMDNTHQLNTGGYFNIKTYGLIVHLLNNDVKIKWAIRAGKAKDATDFTAVTHQVCPTVIAGGASRDFKGGPFVIYAADTAGVIALVNSFYSTNSLTGSNRPKIFRTEADVTVDIRYDLTGTRPKAAILNDGGNEEIHVDLMVAASMPASSYAISYGRDLMSGCYTFASEPHNDQSGLIVDSAIIGIKQFVLNGGNFLAQCAAVTNYENSSYGRFQTSTGITSSYVNIGSTLTYANADLSYSQFEGTVDGINGVVDAWTINSSGTNNQHNHVTGSGANTSVIVGSVSKISSTYSGGLVFYLGTHDFRTNRADHINGIKMYMNAFLTPSILSCSMTVLPFKLRDFTGSLKEKTAELAWNVTSNEGIVRFEIQRSYDGTHFTTLQTIAALRHASATHYKYPDSSFRNTASYYRLKVVQPEGVVKYSPVIRIGGSDKSDKLIIKQNPVHEKLDINYFSANSGLKTFAIYSLNGSTIHSGALNAMKGSNSVSIPLNVKMQAGVYFIAVTSEQGNIISKFIKR